MEELKEIPETTSQPQYPNRNIGQHVSILWYLVITTLYFHLFQFVNLKILI